MRKRVTNFPLGTGSQKIISKMIKSRKGISFRYRKRTTRQTRKRADIFKHEVWEFAAV